MWGIYTDLQILLSALTLHTAAASFSTNVRKSQTEQHGSFHPTTPSEVNASADMWIRKRQSITKQEIQENNWIEISTQFKALKRLSELVNKIGGNNLTCILAVIILYYATSLDELLVVGRPDISYVRLLRLVFFYMNYGGNLLISADICNQVCK